VQRWHYHRDKNEVVELLVVHQSVTVSDRATVDTVTGATAIPFSGDSPPN
jgi:hypothetical protein